MTRCSKLKNAHNLLNAGFVAYFQITEISDDLTLLYNSKQRWLIFWNTFTLLVFCHFC